MRSAAARPGNSTVCSGNSGMLADVALRIRRRAGSYLCEPLAASLLVQMPPKPPLLHDQHVVAGCERLRRGVATSSSRIVATAARFAPSAATAPRDVPAHVRPRWYSHTRVRAVERLRQRLAMRRRASSCSSAARAPRRCVSRRRLRRRPSIVERDGRRVMREVVVDGDAADLAAQFQPALHAAGIPPAPRSHVSTAHARVRARRAIAASAFSALCRPSICQRTSPTRPAALHAPRTCA